MTPPKTKEAPLTVESEEKVVETTPTEEGDYTAKIPEQFQKDASAFVDSCPSEACLDFLSAEISRKRTEMMEKPKVEAEVETEDKAESFDTEGMPEVS